MAAQSCMGWSSDSQSSGSESESSSDGEGHTFHPLPSHYNPPRDSASTTTLHSVFQSAKHSDEEDKVKTAVLTPRQGDPSASGDGKRLPTGLVDMWTDVDPALPRSEIQTIIHTTFAEFKLDIPLYSQPWMQAEDKSSVIALEKARITNGGKIPASWMAAAEESEHGRKWLKIGREQEQAEALARAREKETQAAADAEAASNKVRQVATLFNEVSRRNQQALKATEAAATQAKAAAELAAKAKRTADNAGAEACEAWINLDISLTAKNQARVIAKSAAAEVKRLEDLKEIEVEAEAVPNRKKRKLTLCKSESSARRGTQSIHDWR